MLLTDPAKNKRENVEIYTLGRFLIKRGDQLLSDGSGRSRKVWDLFKFLLAHLDRVILPEILLETMWSEQDYTDPGLAVRSLVFRLRRLLKNLDAPELASGIVFSQGGYKWSLPEGCRLDVNDLVIYNRQAETLYEVDPEAAIEQYRQAFSLYKGEFLPECAYYDWIVPEQSYYRRIYLQIFTRLAVLLKAAERYSEIIELCEKAMMMEYFEEEIHRCYLEALVRQGKNRQAETHYRDMADTFYREMGARPSNALRDVCNTICHEDSCSVNLDLNAIQEGLLHRDEAKGAFICDRDLFRYFYRQESLRSERSGRPVYLGLLALDIDGGEQTPELLNTYMDELEEILRLNLRRGDVVTRYSNVQFLLILPGLGREQAEKVLRRVEMKYKEQNPSMDGILHKKYAATPPPDLKKN